MEGVEEGEITIVVKGQGGRREGRDVEGGYSCPGWGNGWGRVKHNLPSYYVRGR